MKIKGIVMNDFRSKAVVLIVVLSFVFCTFVPAVCSVERSDFDQTGENEQITIGDEEIIKAKNLKSDDVRSDTNLCERIINWFNHFLGRLVDGPVINGIRDLFNAKDKYVGSDSSVDESDVVDDYSKTLSIQTKDSNSAIWTTDKDGIPKYDFAPGELVYIHGEYFLGDHNVDIDIIRPDNSTDSGSTMTDSAGSFVYIYDLDGILGLYNVHADDEANSANTTFSDNVHVDFKQYANLNDLWIGSILQQNNSVYYEGMSVPQRIAFVDIESTTGNVHIFTFAHQATKAGNHVYDWLTSWNQGNVPPLTYVSWGDNIGPHITKTELGNLHNQSGANEFFVDVPDDPFLSHHGSTQDRIDGYEFIWGNRQIRICGNKSITSASFNSIYHDVLDDGDTGDSYIHYELTWESESDQILIEIAGHLAMGGDPLVNNITWAPGAGTSNISGGPYHFKLDEFDGHALGNQDNQIKGADILPNPLGIEVTKTADPTSGAPSTNVDFTIIVDNTGDCDLGPVIVADTLPVGMSYVSDDSGGVEGPAGVITWDLGLISPADPPVVITLVAHIDPGASGTLHNVVDVTGTPPHGNDVTDDDWADVTILSSIEVVKSVHYNSCGPWNDEGIIIDLNGPNAYDWCAFRINVTNNGTIPLNITIKDVLPDGLINGNHYHPRPPDYIDGNNLYWYYDGVYDDLVYPSETISVTIRADMGECDVKYINTAYVTSQYGSSNPFIDNDTAFVKWINCNVEYPIDINQSSFNRGFPIRHAIDGDWAGAQNFTPTLSTLTSVDIYLRKFGTPEFNLTVEIREDHPEGTLLDTVVFTPGEVPSSWDWFTLDFDDVTVTSGTNYFIVCPPAPSGVTTSFGYEWGYAFGNQYDDGAFWFTRDGGALWRDLPTMYEFTFCTYGCS